ncbi:hypothetical protein Rhopal_004502-T1 [Rhodotorula paludigena]|uniref:Uncharacterized protein n=1 Tax=Rhodotorula paludigena TaxID=86838 RepID=A0AAV5GLW2_9BASI|nr:hypothetical protein Rhopal_004502-T1 [Rhodotorula paludigena]
MAATYKFEDIDLSKLHTATPTWDTYLEGSYQLVDPRAWDVLESDDRSDRVYMDFLDHHMGLVQNKAEVMSEWVHIAERRFTRHCRIYAPTRHQRMRMA